MSSADVITLPKLLSKVPEIFGNLPGLIKGSKMSKITDTNTPLGLGVAFEKATDSNPNGVAILYEDRELTYKQFNAWANRIADYLASIGLKKGDTVAVDVENRPELLRQTGRLFRPDQHLPEGQGAHPQLQPGGAQGGDHRPGAGGSDPGSA